MVKIASLGTYSLCLKQKNREKKEKPNFMLSQSLFSRFTLCRAIKRDIRTYNDYLRF
jgi:hypothetical protein